MAENQEVKDHLDKVAMGLAGQELSCKKLKDLLENIMATHPEGTVELLKNGNIKIPDLGECKCTGAVRKFFEKGSVSVNKLYGSLQATDRLLAYVDKAEDLFAHINKHFIPGESDSSVEWLPQEHLCRLRLNIRSEALGPGWRDIAICSEDLYREIQQVNDNKHRTLRDVQLRLIALDAVQHVNTEEGLLTLLDMYYTGGEINSAVQWQQRGDDYALRLDIRSEAFEERRGWQDIAICTSPLYNMMGKVACDEHRTLRNVYTSLIDLTRQPKICDTLKDLEAFLKDEFDRGAVARGELTRPGGNGLWKLKLMDDGKIALFPDVVYQGVRHENFNGPQEEGSVTVNLDTDPVTFIYQK